MVSAVKSGRTLTGPCPIALGEGVPLTFSAFPESPCLLVPKFLLSYHILLHQCLQLQSPLHPPILPGWPRIHIPLIFLIKPECHWILSPQLLDLLDSAFRCNCYSVTESQDLLMKSSNPRVRAPVTCWRRTLREKQTKTLAIPYFNQLFPKDVNKYLIYLQRGCFKRFILNSREPQVIIQHFSY